MEFFLLIQNLMRQLARWSSCFLVWWLVSGCGTGVLLHQEGEGKGVIRYFYQEHDGHMLSPNRTEALQQLDQHCRGSFHIIKEGPTEGRRRVVEGVAGAEVIREKWWGIKFECQ